MASTTQGAPPGSPPEEDVPPSRSRGRVSISQSLNDLADAIKSIESVEELLAVERPPPAKDPLLSADASRRDALDAVAIAITTFILYSAIYFIKASPFAAHWEGESFCGMHFKSALGLAMSLGYLVGKGPSLAFTPKLAPEHLLAAVLGVVILSGGALVFAAVLPPGGLVVCTFVTSFCLAPSWSLMIRFCEGRVRTDAIISFVSFSFIGMSGVVKSIGAWLVGSCGFSERAMVSACSSFGIVVGSVAAVVLFRLPPPSVTDRALRGERRRIASITKEGWMLLQRYGVGICLSTTAYVLIGTLRTLRDYFQPEIFAAAGLRPEAMALSEMLIGVFVLSVVGSFSLILNSWRAFNVVIATVTCGSLAVTLCTLGWQLGWIGGYVWAIGVGSGIFFAYMPLGCVLFDRLLASAREQLTTSMFSLLSDAAVTLAVSVVLIVKEVAAARAGAAAGGDASAVVDLGSGANGTNATAPSALDSPMPPEHAAAAGDDMADFFASSCVAVGVTVAVLTLAAGVAYNLAIAKARVKLADNVLGPGTASLPPDAADRLDESHAFDVPRIASSLSGLFGEPMTSEVRSPRVSLKFNFPSSKEQPLLDSEAGQYRDHDSSDGDDAAGGGGATTSGGAARRAGPGAEMM